MRSIRFLRGQELLARVISSDVLPVPTERMNVPKGPQPVSKPSVDPCPQQKVSFDKPADQSKRSVEDVRSPGTEIHRESLAKSD